MLEHKITVIISVLRENSRHRNEEKWEIAILGCEWKEEIKVNFPSFAPLIVNNLNKLTHSRYYREIVYCEILWKKFFPILFFPFPPINITHINYVILTYKNRERKT